METRVALMKSFRAYDVRGIYPDELNEDLMYRIAKAFVAFVQPKQLLLGMDARQMNPGLYDAAVRAITEEGVHVINLGLITTDMLYFASGKLNLSGFSITASHNPPEYSGVKMVQAGAVAISSDSGLYEIRDRAIAWNTKEPSRPGIAPGRVEERDLLDAYIDHVLSFIDVSAIKPTTIVANTMYGVASRVVEALAKRLPLSIIPLNFTVDGTFPKGSPNPMLPELRQETTDLVKRSQVDFGVAWDGDADRCFFWDNEGNFVEGYYTGVLLAENLLRKVKKEKSEKVIHCARLGWLFDDVVSRLGGESLECKTGHGYIKELMRKEDALFAEEMSGHYYFRDNWYADNGMIPFVIMLEMIHKTGKSLKQLVERYQKEMTISGEINFTVDNPKEVIADLLAEYGAGGKVTRLDGLTVEFSDWRFNVRPSNNEPLLRLNVEGRNAQIVTGKTEELIEKIQTTA